MAVIKAGDPKLGNVVVAFPIKAVAPERVTEVPWRSDAVAPAVSHVVFPVVRDGEEVPRREDELVEGREEGPEEPEEEPRVDAEEPRGPSPEEIEAMLRQARDEARLAGLEEGKAQGFEQGKAQGFEEGRAQGRAEAEAELAEGYREKLADAIRAMDERLREIEGGLAGDVVKLAVRISQTIVGLEVARAPEFLERAVDEALGLFPWDAEVTVRVAPGELEALGGRLAGLGANVTVVGDPGLAAGDFVVESDKGGVDGRVSTALREIEERLALERDRWLEVRGLDGREEP